MMSHSANSAIENWFSDKRRLSRQYKANTDTLHMSVAACGWNRWRSCVWEFKMQLEKKKKAAKGCEQHGCLTLQRWAGDAGPDCEHTFQFRLPFFGPLLFVYWWLPVLCGVRAVARAGGWGVSVWGGCWFTSLCSYCWLGQNHSSEHLCYGHPGSMHHLNHSRLRVFSRTKRKKRKTFAAADGQKDARSASPSSISNQERAGKCLPRRRDKERGGASVGSHYRQRVQFQKRLVHKVRLRNISPFHPSVWCFETHNQYHNTYL